MRNIFVIKLLEQMKKNDKIFLVSCDLGYKILDDIRNTFPNRFLNPMAAEMAGMGICVGLSYNNYIPIFYSITNFSIYRPFEIIRNYVDFEKSSVKIVCSGRDKDYLHDGYSHQSEDVKYFLDVFKNIKQYWPETKEEINEEFMKDFLYCDSPCFLSLKR